ncbi:hypothetical protein D3C86_1590190 [compost metagenome]
MQIKMPAILSGCRIEIADRLFQHEHTFSFFTRRKLRRTPAKHPVDVAVQIALVVRQCHRIPKYHQHAAAQWNIPAKQRTKQQIDNLDRRGFIPMYARRKHQRTRALLERRQFEQPASPPLPAKRRTFTLCFNRCFVRQGQRQ